MYEGTEMIRKRTELFAAAAAVLIYFHIWGVNYAEEENINKICDRPEESARDQHTTSTLNSTVGFCWSPKGFLHMRLIHGVIRFCHALLSYGQ